MIDPAALHRARLSKQRPSLAERISHALQERILAAGALSDSGIVVRPSESGGAPEVCAGAERFISNDAVAALSELERVGDVSHTGERTYQVTIQGRRRAGVSDA